MSALPTLTLTYFNFPGRAEAIRKTLSLASIPFNDTRVSQKTFAEQKTSFPYGALPVIDVEGERFAEMQAILRYTARLAGLYPPPNHPLAAAFVDEVLDAFEDLFTRVLIPTMVERDAVTKRQMRLDLLDGPLPQALEVLDSRLRHIATHKAFQQVPAGVLVHDVLVWDFVSNVREGRFDHIPASLVNRFPAMVGCYDKVNTFQRVNQARVTADPVMMPTLPARFKLTYFDMPGRAEPIRLALHVGGVVFEDERLSYEHFLERKHELPYGHLPVLEVDGVTLAQSTAILRFAGRITGLYPTDAIVAMHVDEVLSHIGELFYALDAWFNEQDAEKRRVLGETLAATTIPTSLASLDKRVGHWKAKTVSSLACGSTKPTIADLSVFVMMQFFELEFFAADATAPKPTDKYTNLLEITRAVAELPQVADSYSGNTEPTA